MEKKNVLGKIPRKLWRNASGVGGYGAKAPPLAARPKKIKC